MTDVEVWVATRCVAVEVGLMHVPGRVLSVRDSAHQRAERRTRLDAANSSVLCLVLAIATAACEATSAERTWSLHGALRSYSPGSATVVIDTREGVAVELPVDSLSESDRDVIAVGPDRGSTRERASPSKFTGDSAPTAQAGLPEAVARVEADALRCRTATDAALVLRLFLATPDLTDTVRGAAELRLAHWSAMADRDMVRFGDSWITATERTVIQNKADQMVQHSRELLRLNQFRLAERELIRASELNPESGKADFFLGLIASLIHDDDRKGVERFQEAIRRDPNNAYAYNNLALCSFYARRTTLLSDHFRRSLELAANPQPIADNIGKIIALVGFRKAVVPDKHIVGLNDLYRMALSELNLKPLEDDQSLGLEFLNPFGKAWDQKDDDGGRRSITETDEVFAGSGTGFVIAPGYVLTNNHVIEGADSIAVMESADRKQLLSATIIAAIREPDLALLKCETLASPALPMRAALPGRGTDLMVLGFPKGAALGLGIKSTRGAVVAMPDPTTLGGFLHSAVVNPGNSGGPIVDNTGAIIGVVVACFRRQFVENTYSIGIPVDDVWPFVSDHLPAVEATEDSHDPKSWAEVDAMVSRSTVLIQCSKRLTGAASD